MSDKPVIPPSGSTSVKQSFDVVWSAMASMRGGMIILGVICVAAIVGIFKPSIYNSLWFQGLEGLLCFNVASCSMKRAKALWQATFPVDYSWVRGADQQAEANSLRLDLKTNQAAVIAYNCLNTMGYKVVSLLTDSGYYIYGEKGKIAPWGTFAVHLSILFIAAGALIGNVFGYNHEISLKVGSSYTVMPQNGQQFEIKLNNFTTEFYEDGSVSDWISDTAVIRDGQEVVSKLIKVNHPLSFNDVSIYQQSYSTSINTEVMDGRGRVIKQQEVIESSGMVISDQAGLAVQAVRYIPDFNPARPMVSQSNEARNPHVLYIIYAGGREIDWGAAPIGKPIKLSDELLVRFTQAVPVSGFQIKYNPGLPIVWLGFFLMTVGFFCSLYIRHKRVWLRITDDNNSSIVKVMAVAGKNQEGYRISNELQIKLSTCHSAVRGG
ncbi:cytochrome c biogenesis protein ResB [Dendrosporobacter sp. 1207_IL3150]|uniref:cytochrome c biogenesis protein ResB n=1 Tax=Dendrosporobacter sp. 1207_IL3150 TaxID=3084054 RepID=UPI002FD96B3A